MPTRKKDRIMVGKIIKIQGLKGWLKVATFTSFPERFTPGATLWLETSEGKALKVKIEDVRSEKEGFLFVRFQNYTTREQVEKFRGALLSIDRNQVPPLPAGEFYHFELIGIRVFEKNEFKGEIADIIEGPNYDYLVVKNQEKESLMPFIREFVREINLQENYIKVSCPEGFWE